MPMVPSPDLTSTILVVLEVALAVIGGFIAALWISLVIWTFKDIRSRSRDIFAQLLATLLVLIFGLPGMLIYFLLRPAERLSDAYERALEEEALLQDIEERLLCPGCKRQIKENYILCPACHTVLKKQCVQCGQILHLKWDLCPYCGAEQVEDASDERELETLAPAYAEPVYEAAYAAPAERPARERRTIAANPQEALEPANSGWFGNASPDDVLEDDDSSEEEPPDNLQ